MGDLVKGILFLTQTNVHVHTVRERETRSYPLLKRYARSNHRRRMQADDVLEAADGLLGSQGWSGLQTESGTPSAANSAVRLEK